MVRQNSKGVRPGALERWERLAPRRKTDQRRAELKEIANALCDRRGPEFANKVLDALEEILTDSITAPMAAVRTARQIASVTNGLTGWAAALGLRQRLYWDLTALMAMHVRFGSPDYVARYESFMMTIHDDPVLKQVEGRDFNKRSRGNPKKAANGARRRVLRELGLHLDEIDWVMGALGFLDNKLNPSPHHSSVSEFLIVQTPPSV